MKIAMKSRMGAARKLPRRSRLTPIGYASIFICSARLNGAWIRALGVDSAPPSPPALTPDSRRAPAPRKEIGAGGGLERCRERGLGKVTPECTPSRRGLGVVRPMACDRSGEAL